MSVFASLFSKDADTKNVDRVSSQVKLVNTLGQSVAVVLAITLAAYKLRGELKKD